jgi:hypothetical protein
MKRILLILFIATGLMSFQTVLPTDYDAQGSKIKLGQNYPNPAIGKTYIEASFSGDAMLTVYNVVGKVIEERVITKSMIVLDVSNYTEGIYLYTLESSGEKVTKRMTVKKP